MFVDLLFSLLLYEKAACEWIEHRIVWIKANLVLAHGGFAISWTLTTPPDLEHDGLEASLVLLKHALLFDLRFLFLFNLLAK